MNKRKLSVIGGVVFLVAFSLVLTGMSLSQKTEDVAAHESTGAGGLVEDFSTVASEPVSSVNYNQPAQGDNTDYNQPAQGQPVVNQQSQDQPLIGGDPNGTDENVGGGVGDVNFGGGGPQADISTPADVGGGTNGSFTPVAGVALCNGFPCTQIAATYHETAPPVPTSYTVTGLDGSVSTHEAAPQGE